MGDVNLLYIIIWLQKLIQEQEKATDYTEMAKLFKINATGVEESDN